MPEFMVLIKTHDGALVHTLTQFESLHAGRADRAAMPCEAVIPRGDFLFEDFTKDMLMEVWRKTPGGMVLDGETVYFLRKKRFFRDNQGLEKISLKGLDAIYLLDGREIEYAAGSSQASKTDVACDFMKDIVRENFVSATDTTRNLAAAYFGVQADDGTGASLTSGFSRQYVLTILQRLCDQSRNLGTWVSFDVHYNGGLPLEFRTYTNQRGVDQSTNLVLSVEAGNLANPSLTYDWEGERTAAYVAGQGEGVARAVGTATNAVKLTESIWSRREVVTENFQLALTASLNSEASALLSKQGAKLSFEGELVETEGTRYGEHWNYGDKLKVNYLGYEFVVRVVGYEINCTRNSRQVKAFLRSANE